MTIDRRYGKIVLECDGDNCRASIEGEQALGFTALWARAMQAGWSAREVAGEWLHGCPDCGRPT
jgi:hypothetical protein